MYESKNILKFKSDTRDTDLIEHILQFILRQSRAFDVFDRTQIFRHTLAVLLLHWLHTLLGQLFTNLRIVAQIGLCTDYQAWDTWTVVVNFGKPFFADVFERGGRGDAEADEKDVGLGV